MVKIAFKFINQLIKPLCMFTIVPPVRMSNNYFLSTTLLSGLFISKKKKIIGCRTIK